MPRLPEEIGSVKIAFGGSVNREVSPEMLAALEATVAADAVNGQVIAVLYVSSAKDQHECPSRHVTGNAVDISRVNGKRISTHYSTDAEVKAIVDGLQTLFEKAPARRENFGPTIQKKEGKDHPVPGHTDHFHWSVNGDHSACSKSLIQRALDLFRARPESVKASEVCPSDR